MLKINSLEGLQNFYIMTRNVDKSTCICRILRNYWNKFNELITQFIRHMAMLMLCANTLENMHHFPGGHLPKVNYSFYLEK